MGTDNGSFPVNQRLPAWVDYICVPALVAANTDLVSTEKVAIALVSALSQKGPCRYRAADLADMMQLKLRQMNGILAKHTECFMKKRRVKRRLVPELEESLREHARATLREVGANLKKGLKPKIPFSKIIMSASLFETERQDLTYTKKLLIASVDSLTKDLRGCFASSEHLAEQIGISRGMVRNLLSDLTRRGYLMTLDSNGVIVERVVRPDLSWNPERAKRLQRKCLRTDLLPERAGHRVRATR
jgi:hypothetical protein